MKLIRTALFFISIVLSISAKASDNTVETRARMVINLMDYISKDYPMAAKDGEVVNEFEFAEMNEFVNNAIAYFDLLQADAHLDSAIRLEIVRLKTLIETKSSAAEVAVQADEVKHQIILLNLVQNAPTTWPNLKNGALLFAENCASCHGLQGRGDGAAGAALQPKPTNFTDQQIMRGVAPFQAYNTVRLGIEGTSMRAYEELTDEQVWDISFYIISLQHGGPNDNEHETELSLEKLASLSDEELVEQLSPELTAAVRTNPHPTTAAKSEIDIARTLLNECLEAYKLGEYENAQSLALEAYLKGVEPIEPRIKASDNTLFVDLESGMMQIRSSIQKRVDLETMTSDVAQAMALLDQCEIILASENRGTAMTAFITISILIREGLEAFFVILAILSVLRSLNEPKAARWIHGGWIAAVVMGVVGWFFAGTLMSLSAASRELMEGLIALGAVVVLLYLGFWLHGKSEASRWKAFVETRIKKLLSQNNMIGLGFFSFVVVFRESIESVLFLSSLASDGRAESSMGVLIGFIISAVALFFIAWAMLRWFKKLPIAKVFLYSSMIILALAFVLAGQGAHALQEGGFFNVSSFPFNIRISALGIYPTYETIATQLLSLICIAILWRWNNRKSLPTPAG